jgi:hypothetical protein
VSSNKSYANKSMEVDTRNSLKKFRKSISYLYKCVQDGFLENTKTTENISLHAGTKNRTKEQL